FDLAEQARCTTIRRCWRGAPVVARPRAQLHATVSARAFDEEQLLGRAAAATNKQVERIGRRALGLRRSLAHRAITRSTAISPPTSRYDGTSPNDAARVAPARPAATRARYAYVKVPSHTLTPTASCNDRSTAGRVSSTIDAAT